MQGRYGGGAPVRKGSVRPHSGLERGEDFPLFFYLNISIFSADN